MRATHFWILPILTLSLFIPRSFCKYKDPIGHNHVEFEFDIDQIIFDGNLPAGTTQPVPDHNVISGIKVYKGEVYVTIPRHGQTGVPATLVKISKTEDRKRVLFSPFPNWDFQTSGKCESLQDVRSIEVDPKTDLMYIADNGNGPQCDPKLLVYDLAKKAVNATYKLENTNKNSVNALAGITVDNKGLVYIANSDKFGSMWIVNTKDGNIYMVNDHSFRGTDFKRYIFGNDSYSINTTINMLALTPDSEFVYYSANDRGLWQVPTNIDKEMLMRGEVKNARKTGDKKHQGFDIEMGDRYLFFSNVDNKSISYWDRKTDLENQREGGSVLVKENEVLVDIQPKLQYFPGKMSLDVDGFLWVVTMDLPIYFNETENADRKVQIVKIFVDNRPYNNPEKIVSAGSGQMFLSAIIVIACCILLAM